MIFKEKHPIVKFMEAEQTLSGIPLFHLYVKATLPYVIYDFDIVKLKKDVYPIIKYVEIIPREDGSILRLVQGNMESITIYTDKGTSNFNYLKSFLKSTIDLYGSAINHSFSTGQAKSLDMLVHEVILKYIDVFGAEIIFKELEEHGFKKSIKTDYTPALHTFTNENGLYLSFADPDSKPSTMYKVIKKNVPFNRYKPEFFLYDLYNDLIIKIRDKSSDKPFWTKRLGDYRKSADCILDFIMVHYDGSDFCKIEDVLTVEIPLVSILVNLNYRKAIRYFKSWGFTVTHVDNYLSLGWGGNEVDLRIPTDISPLGLLCFYTKRLHDHLAFADSDFLSRQFFAMVAINMDLESLATKAIKDKGMEEVVAQLSALPVSIEFKDSGKTYREVKINGHERFTYTLYSEVSS